MMISPVTDVLEELLEQYRPCFSKPQFENFSTYTVGLVTCEGKKNIQAINRTFIDKKDQSSLNRFLTQSPWNLQSVQNKRLATATEKLQDCRESVGYVLLDDTINQKTGKHMQGVGYHYDAKIGKAVLGHDLVTTHYVNGDAEYPINLSLYIKKEICQQKNVASKQKSSWQ
jgi:SRSO17 transposase